MRQRNLGISYTTEIIGLAWFFLSLLKFLVLYKGRKQTNRLLFFLLSTRASINGRNKSS